MSRPIPLTAERGEVIAVLGEPGRDRRTRLLLEAPIGRTLLRTAAPNILIMLAQASTGLVEAYFVGKLGIDALAGVALVFPGVMLMQMMSAGAMGVASRRRSRARSAEAGATTPMLWSCTRW